MPASGRVGSQALKMEHSQHGENVRIAIPSRGGAVLLALLAGLLPLAGHAAASPDWAFPGCPLPPETPAADAEKPFSVPGSARTASRAELAHADVTVDWFPEEHAPLPPIVATRPGKASCGYCHLPDGTGRPENAKLAGLPAAYIVAQLRALRDGARTPVRPDWVPSKYMVQFAGGIDDQELEAAAAYFASIPARSYLRVVEARTVPSIEVKCFTYGPGPGSAVPLGTRILEVPVDVERFERRDPHTEYVAYVPVGSIDRGRRLASGATPGHPPCAACHGAALAGEEALPGPPLAGRFPGYLFRQLYGFRSGARGGEAAAPMRAVTSGLTDADLVDLAAYAASLKP